MSRYYVVLHTARRRAGSQTAGYHGRTAALHVIFGNERFAAIDYAESSIGLTYAEAVDAVPGYAVSGPEFEQLHTTKIIGAHVSRGSVSCDLSVASFGTLLPVSKTALDGEPPFADTEDK